MEKLNQRYQQKKTLLCIGLDPQENNVEKLQHLIDSTAEYALAFKANSAYYEQFGVAGVKTLAKLRSMIPLEIPLIIDCKRGDIGVSSKAYAVAMFEQFGADLITVSPWMGRDSVKPFLEHGGIFVLCKTSNPGACDLQYMFTCGGDRMYLHLAKETRSWGKDIGLVVGATTPGCIAEVRGACPTAWILSPGVGTQGGDLEQTVKAGATAFGGIVINIGRAIAESENPGNVAKEFYEKISSYLL